MKFTALLTTAALALIPASAQENGPDVPAHCSEIPDDLTLINKTYVLPDPFRLLNGKRVKTLADWHCRAAQIRELFQVCRPSFPIFSPLNNRQLTQDIRNMSWVTNPLNHPSSTLATTAAPCKSKPG